MDGICDGVLEEEFFWWREEGFGVGLGCVLGVSGGMCWFLCDLLVAGGWLAENVLNHAVGFFLEGFSVLGA